MYFLGNIVTVIGQFYKENTVYGMARLMLPFIHGECSFFDPALTPFPTVKTLPFITKYFEPETSMLPIPLTSPPREAFHLAPLPFSSLREAASLRTGQDSLWHKVPSSGPLGQVRISPIH